MAAMLRAPLGVNTVRAVAPKVAQKRSVRSFAVVNGDRIGVMGHWLPGTEPPSYLDGTMPADYGASPRDPIAIARTNAIARPSRVAASIAAIARRAIPRRRARHLARFFPVPSASESHRVPRSLTSPPPHKHTPLRAPSSPGFDPLRLGANPETLPYLQEAELMNGRWAMHATAGILFTDAVGLPKFWEAGEAALGDWDLKTLVAIQVVVMGFLEAARIRGFMATGESGVVGNFPFDPTGQDSPAMKVKEVKNGRLAMMSFLGMVSQYAVTGTSPLEGLKAHMANPTGVNIFTSSVGGEFTAFVCALSLMPVYFLFQKEVSDGEDEEFRPIPW